jgi:predicted DNA binding CopG/RHH family protein
MEGRKNRFAAQLKRQITIRIGSDTIEYFKAMSEQTGIPYQNLIDSYLFECATSKKKLHLKWA